ncbi:hypothetical protein JYG33_04350 [Alcaligenes sp. SORT26]|uniref:hypothetical protein n=1 Tax=Alcaligenes sp. SORT26 TaxID=2813780 RepID=UPI001A9D609E|nr:hypothetical protein [Alcaligenes sp. SORT26]QTC00707.1 hypothetical protein JYG33_04350 [Alcaligenes sp. SORT26]
MKSIKSLFIIVGLAMANTAFAGEYSQDGYITEVKVNIQGKVCNIMLSEVDGTKIQGGQWNCDSTMGQGMLSNAQLAKSLNYKVTVTFEGNGATYKPVYSINILN